METKNSPGDLEVGNKKGRRADTFAGIAMFALSLTVALVAGIVHELIMPAWAWFGILAFWLIAVTTALAEWADRRITVVGYGCAVVSSWVLMLSVRDGDGLIVMLLVVVAAFGCHVVPLRWVLVVVALNNLLIFGYMWIEGADLVGTLVFSGFYLIIHVSVVFTAFAMRGEMELRAELEQKNLQLEAAGVLLEDTVAASERLRISRELHDVIGHQLTVLNLELEAAKHRDGDDAREHVERAGTVAKDLLADVRATVGELREADPSDLQQALERMAAAVPSLEVHVEVDPGVQIDGDITAALVRAAQEIMTNTIKHSHADELALTVRAHDGLVTLTGSNDGIAPRSITLGHGLTGLRERMELLGGSLEISSSPHFTVEVSVPLSPAR